MKIFSLGNKKERGCWKLSGKKQPMAMDEAMVKRPMITNILEHCQLDPMEWLEMLSNLPEPPRFASNASHLKQAIGEKVGGGTGAEVAYEEDHNAFGCFFSCVC